VDLARCEVQREQHVVSLTQREVALLRYFAANPGRAISRGELLGEVWGYVDGLRTRATDNAIGRLRIKVEALADEPTNIISVRGVGYRFEWTAPAVNNLGKMQPEPTVFFGREGELLQLGRLLATNRLVTVVGAPGIGKTRLARRFALGWRGPIWFADVAATERLSGLVHVVAASLSIRLDPDQGDSVSQIGRSLQGLDGALLVLDNFEPVAALASETLDQWVRMAPDCRFLVTSRERLLLSGEQCLELGPLSRESALALFVNRAKAASTGFESKNTKDLHELIDRLDRIPLALEFAASRVHLLSPQSLASRLRDLGCRNRDVAPRHRTLRAAFQVSWDLLDATEREAMAQCALFESPFTLEAAEQVLVLSAPVLDVIEGLWNKSMLERVPGLSEPRFRMLSTVREFVRESPQGALDRARQGHLKWCVNRAEALVGRLNGRDAIVSARELASEFADQIAALQRAADPTKAARLLVALDGSPALLGLPDLHLERIDVVLAEQLDDDTRCRLLLARTRLLAGRRRFEHAREALQEAQRLAGDDLYGETSLQQAHLLEAEGQIDGAAAAFSLAADTFRARGNHADLANALAQGARIRFNPADVASTEGLCLEALDVARAVGDRRVEGRIVGHLGVIAKGRRGFVEAERYFQRSLGMARALGDPVATVIQTIHVAGLMAYTDPSPETLENVEGDLRDALDISSHLGRVNLHCAAAGVLLQLLVDANRADEGGEIIDRLPAEWTHIPPMIRAMVWGNIGAMRHLRGEVALADRGYGQATASFAEAGHLNYVWRTQTFHAVFLAEHDRWAEAEALFEVARAGAIPTTIAPWIADVRHASELLHQARRATDPGSAYVLANALISRVEAATALKELETPIRSTHQWIVKCLRRCVPTRYQPGSSA
jgi:predicted ATPase